ncbi:hypothetical protein EVC45_26930 [Paraburkholderia sp. UYCP14C]|uniref:hypothetical protein n=1 Tax=Paraburkholderia sp. UYCP14C TaxID=2511130 RepID=UPI001020ECBE|nr:hypothetical protein [Paraburkholderia sp. UYCP14C]RZF26653.1 hypothetical protein EVC45_26930 [Paraburkholderia sp. UYCP14C]
MHSFSKVFSPFLIAGALVASAQAETAPAREQLDAALYKDGVPIVTGSSIIGDDGKAPFVISNGENIGYGHCTNLWGAACLSHQPWSTGIRQWFP